MYQKVHMPHGLGMCAAPDCHRNLCLLEEESTGRVQNILLWLPSCWTILSSEDSSQDQDRCSGTAFRNRSERYRQILDVEQEAEAGMGLRSEFPSAISGRNCCLKTS